MVFSDQAKATWSSGSLVPWILYDMHDFMSLNLIPSLVPLVQTEED